LRPDEFRDTRFTGAQLIHLAMPGTLDLAKPDRSRLLMSGAGRESEIEFLFPGGLRGLNFDADLVILSHTAVSGTSPSGFDNRVGFVSDFLAMGAGAVLASMWVGEDGESTAFINEFYEHLESGLDPSTALSQSWKDRLKSDDGMNLGSWAGFQLFIR
jgi:CHAT domain-containing protein